MAAHWSFTGAHEFDVARPPYAAGNLADHVGDDPSVVTAHRRALVERHRPRGLRSLAWMDQVHGSRVEVLDEAPETPVPQADALVTRLPGLGLAVLVADCVPVVLREASAGVVAVAHAGRRGLQLGIVPATVEAMAGLGADVGQIQVSLGPSICPGCYEVPAPMQDEVVAVVPQSHALSSRGTPSLDLRAGIVGQLAQSGVAKVEVSLTCTAESDDHYSYRRDGVTGRFAGLVWLE